MAFSRCFGMHITNFLPTLDVNPIVGNFTPEDLFTLFGPS